MTNLKTLGIATVAALTIATSFNTSAQAANGRNLALGLGLLGGALLGATIASPSRAAPISGYGAYGGGYGGGCFRKTVGYTWDGFPVRRTVCY